LDICEVGFNSVSQLKPFFEQFEYLPFREYSVETNLSANLVMDGISDSISTGGFCLVAKEEDEIVGLVSLKKLDWDTRLFGFPIARIGYLLSKKNYGDPFVVKQKLISSLVNRCCKNLLLHVSVRVNKEDLTSIHALESKSFRLMDVLVTYSFDFRKHSTANLVIPNQIRRYKSDEIVELSEIARECFADYTVATDRFHADSTLPKEKSDLLYIKWLVDSSQDPLSEILVAEIDGKPVGFNICNIGKKTAKQLGFRLGNIALTAVKPSERGRSIATSLLSASLIWFADKVDIVETGGQVSNYAIQRAWVRVGFKITRSQCTLHWSPKPDIIHL
jgi:ribosomal protein S18 acetylase RimI-like enzyme